MSNELKFERLGDANETYPASTLVVRKQFVDRAIAELKAEIERLTIDKRNAELRADVADATIAELKEERRWRKCSDELPDDGSEVLATDGDGIWLCYKTTMSDGLPWFQPDGLPHIEGLTHWMPLPSAPKEVK